VFLGAFYLPYISGGDCAADPDVFAEVCVCHCHSDLALSQACVGVIDCLVSVDVAMSMLALTDVVGSTCDEASATPVKVTVSVWTSVTLVSGTVMVMPEKVPVPELTLAVPLTTLVVKLNDCALEPESELCGKQTFPLLNIVMVMSETALQL
jgi:hypothetical protein